MQMKTYAALSHPVRTAKPEYAESQPPTDDEPQITIARIGGNRRFFLSLGRLCSTATSMLCYIVKVIQKHTDWLPNDAEYLL